MELIKLCNRCNQEKPGYEFGNSNRYYCMDCKNIKDKTIYYYVNPLFKCVFPKLAKEYSQRINNDIQAKIIKKKLISNNRKRLKKSLFFCKKKMSISKSIGCSAKFLKEYLESKFQPGMTWENYGLYGWHIDHVRPISSFNMNKKEERLKANHYSNLQPLWAKDNLSKGNKL